MDLFGGATEALSEELGGTGIPTLEPASRLLEKLVEVQVEVFTISEEESIAVEV